MKFVRVTNYLDFFENNQTLNFSKVLTLSAYMHNWKRNTYTLPCDYHALTEDLCFTEVKVISSVIDYRDSKIHMKLSME